MIKVIIVGVNGKMGSLLAKKCIHDERIQVIAGIDKIESEQNFPFPVLKSLKELNNKADVLIDFSSPNSLDEIIDYSLKNKNALVIATTGYIKEDIEKIKGVSNQLRIFQSFNMSIGVNLINDILKNYIEKFDQYYDIEIIDKHHNNKIDSPSGTTMLLLDTINYNKDKQILNGRSGSKRREKKEIGVHSLRGGSIPGEHNIIFAGNGEVIEINHIALSKDIFIEGALKAIFFILKQENGYYQMSHLLSN